jgi:nicotinate-nucleotide pyrophosphorylase (carboxylating)
LSRDFQQIDWDEATAEDCRHIVRLAIREDLEREQDWTTLALVPFDRVGSADIVARESGIVAGAPALALAIEELAANVTIEQHVADGTPIAAGGVVATIRGSVRDLLTSERILLNLLGRLMGIATLTQDYVQVAGARCRVYDTRKTTPGWRRMEKYAVRCGGGYNHRVGLYDAILIKDNHLAQFASGSGGAPADAGAAIRQARQFLREFTADRSLAELIVEVEVDTLAQLAAALAELPDIILLDNMSLDQLRAAVELRDKGGPNVILEASGGVRLDTLRAIAETGVDRVSVGGLTHSAKALDVAMDYKSA